MKANQVIELAKEWVEVYGSQTPGFCGAHLMGGLNYTPPDTAFPAYKDVDLSIVLQIEEDQEEPQEVSYKGLILEYGSYSIKSYESPEVVLADPRLASNLAVNSILSDPKGILTPLHKTVSAEYSRQKWVFARCEVAKNVVRQRLDHLSQAGSPTEALVHLSLLYSDLGGLIAIAGLRPPTHRRVFVLAKEVLERWGYADLQEEILSGYGCAHWDRTQVETYLQDCAIAFDKATAVTRTPIPYGFKLHPHVKPYVIEGSREMIDEGYHREAVLWIAAFLWISNTAIQMDAPEDQKPQFQLKFNQLMSDFGLRTSQDIETRFQQAKDLTDRIFKVADDIVRRNPDIIE